MKIIRLPVTASLEQLTPAVFKQDLSEFGSVTKILETRKVQISLKGMTDPAHINDYTYTAVLVDTDIGRKVVLFQYYEDKRNKRFSGWWFRVYDQ